MNDSICFAITCWAVAVRERRNGTAVSQLIALQSAINTLQRLLLGEEDPDSAARTIATIHNPLLQQGSQSVFELWEVICEAVGALGCHLVVDERLVKLINALSELPDVTDQNGIAVKPGGSWSGFGVFWRDLPVLAIAYREFQEFADGMALVCTVSTLAAMLH